MTYISHLKSLMWEMDSISGKPVIAISGLSGTGKDTYKEILVNHLNEKYKMNLEVHHAGEWFRKIGESYGHKQDELYKFSEARRKDPKLRKEVDLKIDTEMFKSSMKYGGIVVGRLAYAIVGDRGFKIWTNCDSRIAAERIKNDKNRKESVHPVEKIHADLLQRDMNDIQTYEELYNISYFGTAKLCDLTIDNSTGTIEENGKKIVEATVAWLKKNGHL